MSKEKSVYNNSLSSRMFDILRKPIVSEKAVKASESGKVVFQVSMDATKQEVAGAVKAIYNVDVKKDEIISFLKKKNITYPTLMDEAGKSFDDYKVRALPMTYVINKDGYLEGFVSGAITAEQLRKAVNETLKKK